MCPSYRVTHEEMHSTRGRARLLFEMLRGDPLTKGWLDEHVKASLDLCLACKGCKGDCPVNVDMATYKAEFLSLLSGASSPTPRVFHGPDLLVGAIGRCHARHGQSAHADARNQRGDEMVGRHCAATPDAAFAPETFKAWYHRRPRRMEGRPRVISGQIHSTIIFFPKWHRLPWMSSKRQAIRSSCLASLCCGRPLYDVGMLTLAKSLLRQILDTLRPEIAAGTPVVGLEPSCTAVFRDELTNLFPHDEDAKRLAQQTYTLAEFLEKHAPQYQVPALHRRSVVHGHCHQKAIMKWRPSARSMGKWNCSGTLDSGCCGMAGSLGFTAEHYDVSRRVGELVLIPAEQYAAPDTILIADGFSCPKQIAQTTSRRALHTAEVLQHGAS